MPIRPTTDHDGLGNACDSTPNGDIDGDGIDDGVDNCPAVANATQTDTDGDGQGNACDNTPNGDTDLDGIDNLSDNCPLVYNPDQANTDGDTLGNACDRTPTGDTDGDGVDNSVDNCPAIANANQFDADSDGIGDVCDPTPNGSWVLRLNAGTSTTANDGAGNSWTGINTSGFTYTGTMTTSSISGGISGTTDDFIYNTRVRSTSTLTYTRSGIPNGSYTVRLYFADTNSSSATFHIDLQGVRKASSFRPYNSGNKTAVTLTYSNIQVTNGTLTLLFTKVTNYAFVSGIEITNAP